MGLARQVARRRRDLDNSHTLVSMVVTSTPNGDDQRHVWRSYFEKLTFYITDGDPATV
jgi:hypothetical protein